jgi:hypothetical protein
VSELSDELPVYRDSTGAEGPDLHPARIPGYYAAPFTQRAELLDEKLFWMGHLYHSSGGGLLYGPGYDWAAHRAFNQRLWRRADWPTFTIPLATGHLVYVVYRTIQDEEGVDYLVHHPEWEQAALLARDDGHFLGPGFSWPDLLAAADNGLHGGTTDPHARLLLLLPAFGDAAIPHDARDRLAAALRARLGTLDAEHLAAAMLKEQGLPGPVRWITTEEGVRVNNGRYSFRNSTNHFALEHGQLARVSAALAG